MLLGYCCAPVASCNIFDDDFNRSDSGNLGSDWSEVSGGWNIDTCRLECDSDGICICQTAHPDSEARQIVEVDIYGDTEADSFQIILDYVDSDNYHYAQWEIVTNELKFYKRTGGVSSQLGATETVALAESTWHSLKACFSGTTISASANDGTVYGRSTTEHGGYKAGVGGVMGDVDPVYFDDFDYDKYWSATNTKCATCSGSLSCCTDGIAPELVKIVIAGMANNNCTNCSSMNGTYIGHRTVADAGCHWDAVGSHSVSCTPISATADELYLTVTELSGRRIVFVIRDAPYLCYQEWYDSEEYLDDCMEWNSTNVTWHGHSDWCCDGSSSTAAITTL